MPHVDDIRDQDGACVCADACAVRAAVERGTIDKAVLDRCCRQCVAELFLDGQAGWVFLLDTNTVRIA